MDTFDDKYNIEGFAEELGVEMRAIAGLFASYLEEMQSETESMIDFLTRQDWIMLQRVIHNIKGVSANLNVNDVFAEAEKFDILLKSGNAENAGIYVEKIVMLIKNAEGYIKKYFSENGISL